MYVEYKGLRFQIQNYELRITN